jgi:hypothetical protein
VRGIAAFGRQHHQPTAGSRASRGSRAADAGLLSSELAAGISRIKGVKQTRIPVLGSFHDGLATSLVWAFTTALLSKVTGFSYLIWFQS